MNDADLLVGVVPAADHEGQPRLVVGAQVAVEVPDEGHGDHGPTPGHGHRLERLRPRRGRPAPPAATSSGTSQVTTTASARRTSTGRATSVSDPSRRVTVDMGCDASPVAQK